MKKTWAGMVAAVALVLMVPGLATGNEGASATSHVSAHKGEKWLPFWDVNYDATGRVLVSPELRQAAGIAKDAMLLGMGQHFELWDKASYEAQEAKAMAGEMPEVFKDFSF